MIRWSRYASRHYLRRLSESPPRFLAQKLSLIVSAIVFEPVYRWQRWRGGAKPLTHRQVHNVCALGHHLRRGLELASTGDGQHLEEAMRRASRAIDQGFPCLGFGECQIPHGEQWNRDHFHDFQWDSTVYFTRCDFVSADHRCDVKIPWECSRLQFLPWLAEASILESSRSREYATRFKEIARDWVASNQTGFGVNWTCGMEVAIRSINLGLALAVFSSRLEPDDLASIGGALREHLTFLRRFPEMSDIAGNHLLADLMGVAFLTALLDGVGSDSHVAATRSFFEEADRQFDESGCHIEHALHYQVLCLEMVAVVAALAEGEVRKHVLGLLRAGVEFCNAVAEPFCDLPIFGDADGGHVIWFGRDSRGFSRLEESAALLSGDLWVGPPDDFTRWIAALAGRSVKTGLPPAGSTETRAPSVSVIGPYALVKNSRTAAIMRWGAHGLRGRAPHDHDDALSIWVFHGGSAIIAESGCHSYTLSSRIRKKDLISSSHNVLWRDGECRHTPVGGSIGLTVQGGPTASRPVVSSSASGSTLDSELEGAAGDWTARTLSLAEDGRLTVVDRWRWAPASAGRMRWHLGPSIHPRLVAEDRVLLRGEASAEIGILDLDSETPFSIDLGRYRHSALYGCSTRAWFVEVRLLPASTGSVSSCFCFCSHQPLRPRT